MRPALACRGLPSWRAGVAIIAAKTAPTGGALFSSPDKPRRNPGKNPGKAVHVPSLPGLRWRFLGYGLDGLGLRGIAKAFEADERAGGEQFVERSAVGQAQFGREFGQGVKDERPRVHMVVGHLQTGVVEYSIAE